MAAPISVTTVTTASEAFAYPLPTVRQFHKQLHTALDEKNARLRALVGGSYRQLLGTAEMIVDMRKDIVSAEGKLSHVAKGCSRSAVGRKVGTLGQLGVSRDLGPGESELRWVAKMKVLSGCVVVVGRLLKGKEMVGQKQGRGRNLVTAGKVLVLSRLLIKSLGDEEKNSEAGSEELLEELRKRLGNMRRRLLREVERKLERVEGDGDDLTEALCAYSLATSSGSKDVLRHFLHVRGEAMAMSFEEELDAMNKDGKQEGVMRALGLYTMTLLDVQALAPRRLGDALLNLKRRPLLQEHAVTELEGLRLDVCDRWFGDEILFFTPYIRHDDLDGPHAVATLQGWAKKASETLLRGFEKTLERVSEFKTLMALRTEVFEMWIRESGKVKGFDSSTMLDGLRTVINARLVGQLEIKVAKLHLVGTEVEAALGSWLPSLTGQHSSLWNEKLLKMEISQGAGLYKQSIISNVHGRNDAISRVVNGYETWRYLIDEMASIIEQVRKQRWDDDLESLEDDLSLERTVDLLSTDDPELFQSRLDSSLELAFDALHQKLATFLMTYKESDHADGITIFLLRVVRDIRTKLPKLPQLSTFGIALIPELHRGLVSSVSAGPLSTFMTTFNRQKCLAGRALWEGSPELPIYPSPLMFRFLHSLTSSMAIAGGDLWSSSAVAALKLHLREVLVQKWSRNLESAIAEETFQVNGHHLESDDTATGKESSEDVSGTNSPTAKSNESMLYDALNQSLFDMILLKHCLGPNEFSNSVDNLTELETRLISRTELTAASTERLEQSVQEYWKRTSLLFGLLA